MWSWNFVHFYDLFRSIFHALSKTRLIIQLNGFDCLTYTNKIDNLLGTPIVLIIIKEGLQSVM